MSEGTFIAMEQQTRMYRTGKISQGFSLLELGLVIFLMSILLLFIKPRWTPSLWSLSVTQNQLIASLRALQWRQMHDAELNYIFVIDNEQRVMGTLGLDEKIPCQQVLNAIEQPKSFANDQVIQRYQQSTALRLPICFDQQGRPLGAIKGCNGPCLTVVGASNAHICVSAGGDIRACKP